MENNEMKILYHIVPKNDGYTFLCQNSTGMFLVRKEVLTHSDELVFNDSIAAEKFIEENNLDEYKAEAFLRRDNDE